MENLHIEQPVIDMAIIENAFSRRTEDLSGIYETLYKLLDRISSSIPVGGSPEETKAYTLIQRLDALANRQKSRIEGIKLIVAELDRIFPKDGVKQSSFEPGTAVPLHEGEKDRGLDKARKAFEEKRQQDADKAILNGLLSDLQKGSLSYSVSEYENQVREQMKPAQELRNDRVARSLSDRVLTREEKEFMLKTQEAALEKLDAEINSRNILG